MKNIAQANTKSLHIRDSLLIASLLGGFPTISMAAGNVPTEACLEASADCYRSLELPDHAGSLHYYASLAPAQAGPQNALIVIHGHPRDANVSFQAGISTARKAGRLADTLIVAPLFQVASETSGHCQTPGLPPAEPEDALWSCESWLDGGVSAGPRGISSFAALDTLVGNLKKLWPSLTTITFAGFSAGAQMLQRQIGFAAEAPAGMRLRYVVADPGTWLYFDPERPQLQLGAQAAGAADCGAPAVFPGSCSIKFALPAGENCATSNHWKYGTNQLPAQLLRNASEARAHYAAADIHYLEGELDSSDHKGGFYSILDKSCAAQQQGPYRLQRGVAYAAYDRQFLATDGRHAMTIIPACGHNVDCVLGAAEARNILFRIPEAVPSHLSDRQIKGTGR